MKYKIVCPILLFLIFCLALFLRVYFPWDSVFQEPIRYAADDGVYHMRIVENLLLGGHYPKKIYFDPYTYFPYGMYIPFAPLYDQLLAGIIWIAGLGHPTLELINKIAPFYPAVLGSLGVIVIYFIGKVLWGIGAGLFSAFLMALSQPYLFRSLLGATDHHQAEALFSSLAILFLILAIKNRKKQKFWLLTLLAGISLGLYFLFWTGALLFLFIIFVSIILYYLIEYLSGSSQNWILSAGAVIFLIALLMISPFFGHPDFLHSILYNIRHLGFLLLGIFAFLFVGWLGNLTRKKQMIWLFPGFLALAAVLFLLILGIAFPPLFAGIIETFKAAGVGLVPHELAREMVGEMLPLGIQGAFSQFGCLFYLSFIALGFIIYNFVKKRRPEDLLIIIWFLVIVLMTGVLTSAIGQNRFSFYLSANISLLCGFLVVKGINFAVSGWKISQEFPQKIYLRFGSALLIFNIVFFVFYPFPLNLIERFPKNLPKIIDNAIGIAKSGTIAQHPDWYETLKWLRENTPDPGLDYYALYQEPKFNPQTGEIEPYSYPETAYGIMSSWDVGNIITYYAHRIPNASNFQLGLGRGGEITEPGETTFFIENDEKKAVEFLDRLKTRYLITNFLEQAEYGTFASRLGWALGGSGNDYLEEGEEKGATIPKYDKSMIVRLHLLDCREWVLEGKEESRVLPLDHFRLVYESPTTAYRGFFERPDEDNIKRIKIFEYVKGAKVLGKAPEGTLVEISTKIKTNQGREFIYKKSVESKDENFEFIVPYSTFGKEGVFAGPYKLKINGTEKEINVSEQEILRGEIIEIK